ncbi:AIM24 family protein [Nocardioides sp. YIM 152588]|uniref:AIM24 family protein n=1 Tax=Nocardioides sp. YIM 152588 TaxID=3158259 RepID=UPI0032E3AAD3
MTAAWHPDPTGRHELRYWDGTQWTDHVADGGEMSVSPLHEGGEQPAEEAWVGEEAAGPEPDVAEPESPMPTQQLPTQQPAQQQPAQQQPAEQQPAPQHSPAPGPMPAQPPAQQPGGSITGELIDGRYTEVTGLGPVRQNDRLLRVRITEPFMAQQGSMVAYQGNVNFAYQGSGAGKFLKKAFTGEGLSLMRVEGQGDVFLADSAKQVHILHLDNSGISANGKSVLAFSANLDWNVERVRGGSIAAGGLFNTTLRGTGWVAITTDGDPVVLDAGEAPTYADANALVAWSVHLQTSLRSTFTAGSMIGRGSGEAFQVAFSGRGFVIVQPSEGGVASHGQ